MSDYGLTLHYANDTLSWCLKLDVRSNQFRNTKDVQLDKDHNLWLRMISNSGSIAVSSPFLNP